MFLRVLLLGALVVSGDAFRRSDIAENVANRDAMETASVDEIDRTIVNGELQVGDQGGLEEASEGTSAKGGGGHRHEGGGGYRSTQGRYQ